MKEIEKEVKTYMINMECDCKEGYLIFSGQFKPAIEKDKKIYIHRCTKCGKMAELKIKYPLMKYGTINA